MQLEIDGRLYDFPLLSTLDLDEDRIFYQATGMHTEDAWLGVQEGGALKWSDLVDNEGFLAAMARIAYRREHPDVQDEIVVEIVGRQKRMDMLASIALSLKTGDDDSGKVEGATNAPNGSSTSSSSERPTTSEPTLSPGSTSSESRSVPPVVALGTTGTPVSDTSPASAPVRLAV